MPSPPQHEIVYSSCGVEVWRDGGPQLRVQHYQGHIAEARHISRPSTSGVSGGSGRLKHLSRSLPTTPLAICPHPPRQRISLGNLILDERSARLTSGVVGRPVSPLAWSVCSCFSAPVILLGSRHVRYTVEMLLDDKAQAWCGVSSLVQGIVGIYR